jgi:luciferase family oxidoreductase group 1
VTSPLKLGVLDFSWVESGQSPARALRDTFAVARQAEALGYARLWVGEHHVAHHASGSPQILAAVLAATTKRIRIGVGAILLYYYSPLKVAEDFRLLESIFGRIDLGVGRGRADDPACHLALLDGRGSEADGMLPSEAYERRLNDVVALLRASPGGAPRPGMATVIPQIDVSPEIWVCGGQTAAVQAAQLGARFCCTLFHGRPPGPAYMDHYRASFRPSAQLAAPYAAIAVCQACAETEGEAARIREAFPRPHYFANVVGSARRCRDELERLSAAYGADEVMILDMAPTLAQRSRTLELLSPFLEARAA